MQREADSDAEAETMGGSGELEEGWNANTVVSSESAEGEDVNMLLLSGLMGGSSSVGASVTATSWSWMQGTTSLEGSATNGKELLLISPYCYNL